MGPLNPKRFILSQSSLGAQRFGVRSLATRTSKRFAPIQWFAKAKSLLLFVALSGCSPAVYVPDIDLPCEWSSDIHPTLQDIEDNSCLTWWDQLGDPVLNELMRLAEVQNVDLKIAATRVSQARSQVEVLEEDFCATWVTLSAEVAKNYIELRGSQRRLSLLETKISEGEKQAQLMQDLKQRGVISDKAFSEITLDQLSMQAEHPMLELLVSNAIHRISTLLGYAPGDLFEYLSCPNPLPQLPCCLPIGLPCELLQRRPDIRKAEQELIATQQTSPLLIALIPRFLVRECNQPTAQEAFYTYQKTVLEALEEAENAISAYTQGQQKLCYLEESCRILEQSLTQESLLYQQGVNDLLSYLKISKETFSAQDLLIQGQVEQLLNYVSVFKALGCHTPSPA